MKTLYQIVESILDTDFDVTEDDVNPLRPFVDKYKSRQKNNGAHYIRSQWDIKEFDRILSIYGHDIGNVLDIDFAKEVKSAHNGKEIIVLVDINYTEFHILVPTGNKWKLYTSDPSFSGSSLLKGIVYTNDELLGEYFVFQREQMYVLRDDQFLKDLQKYLA